MSLPLFQSPAGPAGHPVPSPAVTAYQLDDDLVLYDTRTAEAHVLNLSAAKIWQLCDGSRSISDLADELSRSYALDPARAQADVDELVSSLQAAGLLIWSS